MPRIMTAAGSHLLTTQSASTPSELSGRRLLRTRCVAGPLSGGRAGLRLRTGWDHTGWVAGFLAGAVSLRERTEVQEVLRPLSFLFSDPASLRFNSSSLITGGANRGNGSVNVAASVAINSGAWVRIAASISA